MKIKEEMKKHKKKIVIGSIIIATVVIIVTVAIFLCFFGREKKENSNLGNMPGGGNAFHMTDDVIAASGVTNVGITEESFAVENLSVGLEIEEVYITSETEISRGDKVLKVTQKSVEEAREELETTLREAWLAYRAGAIEYEKNKISAAYDRDSKILNGKYARAVYDDTVDGLQKAVDDAQEKLTEIQEEIAEYQSYVNDASYSTYFDVDKYKEIYDANLDAIEDKLEEWGVSWTQITGQGDGNMNTGNSARQNTAGGTVSGGDAQAATGALSSDIQILSSMYKILEQNMSDWRQAQEEYEEALVNAPLNLQTRELQLPSLEQALLEAKENYETSKLQAELTMENTLANAESAEKDYETAIQKAESDYEALKEAWEDATENLELFESMVGDGYFYASADGTILRTMVRAGEELRAEGKLFFYSNPEEMTVTVSVDQSDISKVTLGSSALIQSAGYGSFVGTVTQLNPISDSDSRTSVTYNVTVTFHQEDNRIEANESVTVILGADKDTLSQMSEGGGKWKK